MHEVRSKAPVLYIFSGLPGSGKSTLSQLVARQIKAIYLRIDTIEQGLRELCSFEVQAEGYGLAYRIASDNLRLGVSVVADSCNPIELTRREWERVARDARADYINIEIVCSDSSEHRLRAEARAAEVSGLRLPTWSEIENRAYEDWTVDRVIVDTAGRSATECASDLLSQLSRLRAASRPSSPRLKPDTGHAAHRGNRTVSPLIQIRRLTPADATAFQSLRLAALREAPSAFASSYEEEAAFPASVIEERLAEKPDRGPFGAFEGNELVGLVGLGRENMNKLSHKAHIWGMYVAPKARGKGVGRELLREALSFARSVPGVRQVHVSSNATNARAIALYESVGFKVYGREPDAMLVNGEPFDELHMCLRF